MTKIAFLGDSLVDTIFFSGKFWELELLLKKEFPDQEFELLNYGVGSTNAELGLFRLTNSYEYKERGRSLPALSGQKPDIIIIGDFAYNHWTDSLEDLERYRKTINEIIIKAKKITNKVWLYISMSPNKELYVTGIPWLGWDENKRIKEYETTKLYQSEFLKIATKIKLPLIDCLQPSTSGEDGDPRYISNVDFIHPSAAMRQLVAKITIAQLKSENKAL